MAAYEALNQHSLDLLARIQRRELAGLDIEAEQMAMPPGQRAAFLAALIAYMQSERDRVAGVINAAELALIDIIIGRWRQELAAGSRG